VLQRFPDLLEVLLGQLPGALHGLTTAGGEEDPVDVPRRVAGDPLGQLDRGGVRVGPQREVRQLRRLVGGGLSQLGAPVAHLHGEQPGQSVQVALARVVPDVCTLTTNDHRDMAMGVAGHPGEVHPHMLDGPGRQRIQTCLGDVLRCCSHGGVRPFLFGPAADRFAGGERAPGRD
jgi:hypothetical protein